MTDPSIREKLNADRRVEFDKLLNLGIEDGLSAVQFRRFLEISDILGWKMKTHWEQYDSHPERIFAYLRTHGNKPQKLSEIADVIAEESGLDRTAIYLAGARMVNKSKTLTPTRYSNGNIDTVKIPDALLNEAGRR